MEANNILLNKIIELAFLEDLGVAGDVTSKAFLKNKNVVNAEIVAKQDMIVSCLDIIFHVFNKISNSIDIELFVKDGDEVHSGKTICKIAGPAYDVLSGERICLNFLMRACGIATLTRKCTNLIKHCKAKVAGTRKTLPGLRIIDKQAVIDGGGVPHRFGLYDGCLIKENHIAAAGSISAAIEQAKYSSHHLLKVEVEVETVEQLKEALNAGADIALLDNMELSQIIKSVKITQNKIPLEVSGGVNINNIVSIAETGVDYISLGMLTHSSPAADLSLLIK